MKFGVLALQGDFEAHQQRLIAAGDECSQVRRAHELEGLSGLVFPGGESTAMLKLLDEELWRGLVSAISGELPVFATCAGAILLAKKVSSPAQKSLGLLDIDIERNAYGRQVDSFVQEGLEITAEGKVFLGDTTTGTSRLPEGVFIRAPRISRVGSGVKILMTLNGDPVLVRQGNISAATFHPELSNSTYWPRTLLINRS